MARHRERVVGRFPVGLSKLMIPSGRSSPLSSVAVPPGLRPADGASAGGNSFVSDDQPLSARQVLRGGDGESADGAECRWIESIDGS